MKKIYERPLTTVTAVETESGFMSGSVYEVKENTEDLEIEDQQVQDTGDMFDFSGSSDWKSTY